MYLIIIFHTYFRSKYITGAPLQLPPEEFGRLVFDTIVWLAEQSVKVIRLRKDKQDRVIPSQIEVKVINTSQGCRVVDVVYTDADRGIRTPKIQKAASMKTKKSSNTTSPIISTNSAHDLATAAKTWHKHLELTYQHDMEIQARRHSSIPDQGILFDGRTAIDA